MIRRKYRVGPRQVLANVGKRYRAEVLTRAEAAR